MSSMGEYFVDRQEQLEFCLETFNSGQGNDILLIQGSDGMGKTTLLNELERACNAAGLLCAHVDFTTTREYSSYPNFLSALTDLWCQLNLGTLEELSQLITALYPNDGRRAMAGLAAAVPVAGITIAHTEPTTFGQQQVVTGVIENIGPGAQAAIGNNIVQVQGQFNLTIRQDDARVIEPLIRTKVTEAFQGRLKQLTLHQKTVILFDSWEAVLTEGEYLKDPGAWICDELLNLLSNEEISNCVVVIATADEPGLGQLMRNVRRIPFGPLPGTAVRDYFQKVVTLDLDDEALTQFTEISQAIPLAMALLADGANKHRLTYSRAAKPGVGDENTGVVIGYAVDRYLESLPVAAVEAIRIGTVPHRLDRVLLTELDVSVAEIDEIIQCSFVSWDADREYFTYHPTVRRHFLAWWDVNDLKRYRQLSRKALGHFTRLAADAATQGQPAYEYEREVLYHQLIEDEAIGFGYLTEKFEDAVEKLALAQAQGFVDQGVELQRRGMISGPGRTWLDYFQARLNFLRSQGDKGEAVFKRLVDTEPDQFLQALARWNLGNIRVDQHHWSEGVRLYRASLTSFLRLKKSGCAARVMLALGNAYCDLAQASGGISQRRSIHPDPVSSLSYVVQHLPFLAYEQLVRRNRFLPNWYFGTNYQDWIVAYLLIEGAKWCHKAEKEQKRSGSHFLFQTQLSLAKTDHRLNRWSRARRRYSSLMESITSETARFSYRRAQVALGRGRTLFDERKYEAAEADLQEAIEGFTHFADNRSIGIAGELLGQLYTAQNQPEKAIKAWKQSLTAYQDVDDPLAATCVASLLEDLAAQPTLPENVVAEARHLAEQVNVRQYLVRFPDRMLQWFRRLALIGALPLTYGLVLVFSLALVLTFQIVEGELLLATHGWNAGTALTDILILSAIAILPALLIMWFYRLVYTLLGMIVVYFLGRRLSPIEREQPRLITCNSTSVVFDDPSNNEQSTLEWADVDGFFSVHYCLRHHPLQLVSSSLLTSKPGAVMVFEAVTSGYDHLIREIQRRLNSVQPDLQKSTRDFIVFSLRWVLATTLIVALIAGYFLWGGLVDIEYHIAEPGGAGFEIETGPEQPPELGQLVHTRLTSIYFAFVPTWLLFGAAVVLWRLTIHQLHIRRLYQREHPSLPIWVIGLTAFVLTLLTVLWIWAIHLAQ